MSIKLTRKQAAEMGLPVPKKRHKYNAVAEVHDGIKFASKREARRYAELQLLIVAGKIMNLDLQPSWDLHAPGGQKVGKYTADFRYQEIETGRIIIEDVKSPPTRTTAYRMRVRHAEAEYGITITEVV
jgi:hypothetical protein